MSPDIKPKQLTGFWRGLLTLMKNHPFLKLALVLLFYIGVEVSFGTFFSYHLRQTQSMVIWGLSQLPKSFAAYWVFMFIGRLLFAKFIGQRLNSHTLFLCSVQQLPLLSVSSHCCLITFGQAIYCWSSAFTTRHFIDHLRSSASSCWQTEFARSAILIVCSIGGNCIAFLYKQRA